MAGHGTVDANRAGRVLDNGFLGALDQEHHLAIDVPLGAETMIIAFGGMGHQIGRVPPFEFFKVLGDAPIARCFLRDPDQAWYQLGVRGQTSDIATTAALLSTIVEQNGITRFGCVGASAGGFAAILFGSLIRADYVHAFNPQSILRSRGRARVRSTEKLRAMKHNLDGRDGTFDLRPLIRAHAHTRTEIHLHVGAGDAIDVAHARRLRREAAVAVHSYDRWRHATLTPALRDDGTLRTLLMAGAAPQ